MALFQPGQSGNPAGMKRGAKHCGRTKALAALDHMLGRKKNIASLQKALEDNFNLNPVRFFKDIIMPLLPKEAKLSVNNSGVVSWQSIVGGPPEPPSMQAVHEVPSLPAVDAE